MAKKKRAFPKTLYVTHDEYGEQGDVNAHATEREAGDLEKDVEVGVYVLKSTGILSVVTSLSEKAK